MIIRCQHYLLLFIKENEVVKFEIENVTNKVSEVFEYVKNVDIKIASVDILNFEAEGDLK